MKFKLIFCNICLLKHLSLFIHSFLHFIPTSNDKQSLSNSAIYLVIHKKNFFLSVLFIQENKQPNIILSDYFSPTRINLRYFDLLVYIQLIVRIRLGSLSLVFFFFFSSRRLRPIFSISFARVISSIRFSSVSL